MKPTVPGIPASASMAIVIGQASHGLRAPRPARPDSSSPSARSCWTATITANAVRFMNRYRPRYSTVALTPSSVATITPDSM